jgi:hypothetical protein
MAVTPLQPSLIANRIPTPQSVVPNLDFSKIQKQFADASKITVDYIKSLGGLTKAFGTVGKSTAATTKSVKEVDRSFNLLGVTVKGTAKELIQVGTALTTLSGSFFDLQQRVGLVTAPLKGVVDALGAISDKAKGVEIAQAIGIDTSGIQKLELFRAGIFGNTEALQQFRTVSQTAGVTFTLNLTKLNTILKASKEELRDVGQEARKLSKELNGAVSSVDILAGQYQIASAGFTKAIDSNAIAKAAGVLSTVGFNDFFSTADLVTKSLRAYGLEASKAGEVAAKLNAVVEVGITTIPELAAGFGETAVVANAFGISLDQLGAAIATITTQGSSTPEALTGIEALLRTLANQSPQATEALAKLTLNGQRVKFDIATVQAKGLGGALTDVFKAANGNVEILREIIPESRALQAALALAAQGGSLFAKSLNEISQSSPEKLSNIFGEVQEDPSIKLKAIATRAEELVSSLSGSFDNLTNSALGSLANFVSVTESIANNPVIQKLGEGFLFVSDIISKLTGVFGALGGAGLSVLGTLISLNLTNTLFGKGLAGIAQQGSLLKESIFGVRNFGLAVQQLVGIDTTKSVITNLQTQIEDLEIKGKALRLLPLADQDAAQIQEVDDRVETLKNKIVELQQQANKPTELALQGVKEAIAEVQALDQELEGLAANDPKRADLLNKQADAIGRAGEERLKLEQEINNQQKAQTITAAEAEARRREGSDLLASLGSKGQGIAAFDTATQTTTLKDIQQELEKEKAKGTAADATRVANLAASIKQLDSGVLGVLDKNGRLTDTYRRQETIGRTAALTVAKAYDFLTGRLGRTRAELQGIDAAQRAVLSSQNINNAGAAFGKLFSTLPSLTIGAFNGLWKLTGATVRFGADLLSQFLNPLTLGLAAISLASSAFDAYNKGLAFQQSVTEKLAEAQNRRTEAIRDTTKALEDQARVQKLVASGFTEKQATKIVDEDNKRAELRAGLESGVSAERQSRISKQLATNDLRSADVFLREETLKTSANRLGLGTDNGEAVGKTTARNITTALLTGGGAIAVGTAYGGAIASAFAAAGTVVAPGIGTIIGGAIGAIAGLAIAEAVRKAQGEAESQAIIAEASARKRLELEQKFKPNEAATAQERTARQARVDQGVSLFEAQAKALQSQAGADANVIEQLKNKTTGFLAGQGEVAKQIQNVITANNKLIEDVNTSLEKNQIPESLFNDADLTNKVNSLLKGSSTIDNNALIQVEARLEAEKKALQDQKQAAQQFLDKATEDGDKAAIQVAKSQVEKLVAQESEFDRIRRNIDKKVKIANTQIQNAFALGQGAAELVKTDEIKSITSALQDFNKAISSTATDEDINKLPSLVQSLGSSFEQLSAISTEDTLGALAEIQKLLANKDIVNAGKQPVLALQNIVTQTTRSVAQRQVVLAENAVRRIQGLANAQDASTARAGQEAQTQAELKVIEARIQAAEKEVAIAQGANQKEVAANELALAQQEKKNKLAEQKAQTELNAANLVFERQKAIFDLEKARLDLTRTDLELKKQVFEKFGLATESTDVEIARNRLAQLESDAGKQRLELAKERADLLRVQQEGLAKQRAAQETLVSTAVQKTNIERKEFDPKQFADARASITKQEQESIAKARQNTTSGISPDAIKASTEGVNSNYADVRKASQFTLDKVKKAEEAAEQKVTAIRKQAAAERQKIDLAEYNARLDFSDKQAKEENARTNKKSSTAQKLGEGKIVVTVRDNRVQQEQSEELKRLDERNKLIDEGLKKKKAEAQLQIDIAEAYDGVLNPLDRQSKKLVEVNTNTTQVLAALQQINPLYVSQEALLGGIQSSAGLQILNAKRTLDVEKQKLDVQEKLLKKNGLLTAEAKKQIDDQRQLIQTQFQQEVVSIQFEARQASIDAFARKIAVGIEQKIKGLDITRNALGVFAESFEDSDSKEAVDARKQAAAIGIDIATRQAALAEQTLKIEQEKTLNQLKQNDLQLQFLDIQLKIQGTQTKDKDLLDAITSARGSISGLRANIGAEIQNAPARFAEEQKLQRQQSVLDVSSTALRFQSQFGKPDELKKAQEEFKRVNNLNLNRPVGNTGVNNAVQVLQERSTQQQEQFTQAFGSGIQRQPVQQTPIRRQADGSITNQPPNYTVNINVAGTNATPQEIGKVVREQMLNTTKELLRR